MEKMAHGREWGSERGGKRKREAYVGSILRREPPSVASPACISTTKASSSERSLAGGRDTASRNWGDKIEGEGRGHVRGESCNATRRVPRRERAVGVLQLRGDTMDR